LGETKLQREARRRTTDVRVAVGRSLRDLREDANLTRAAVAEAAGIDASFVGRIESGERPASLATLVAIATVLGAELSVRPWPTPGPRLRDRIQAAAIERVVRSLHPRWIGVPEVPVYRPARGVVDLVIHDHPATVAIEGEMHSRLLRLEEQVRRHREKEESLGSSGLWRGLAGAHELATSRLLILRSTRELRDLANAFASTLAAAYPARARDAIDALVSGSDWPGAAVVWVRVEAGSAELLEGSPRGVRLGR
jgi:transcriptional regulator with XRE-family HTH domain